MGFYYTSLAWAVVIPVGYYLWKAIQRPNQRETQSRAELKAREKAAQKEKDAKARKLKNAGESSGNEARKRVKAKKEEVETIIPKYDDSPEENVDNLEFARQLSNAKAGTSMAPKSESSSRQKSVKLSKAMATKNDEETKKINAEQGSDGDDDLSSVASPEFNATTPKSGDVSDMLENTTSGPSVLRLTESTQPAKPKKAAPKPKEPELTQKQRQNKAKKEQERLAREEAEKERRKLEEAQRRRAREAEGRKAKDGTSTIYTPPPPKTNAWSNADKENSAPVDNAHHVDLLETFEGPSSSTRSEYHEGQGNGIVAPSKAPKSSSLAEAYASLGSEDEQMRLIEEDNGWSEVKTKKSKGKLPKQSSPEAVSAGTSNGTTKFDGFEQEA